MEMSANLPSCQTTWKFIANSSSEQQKNGVQLISNFGIDSMPINYHNFPIRCTGS